MDDLGADLCWRVHDSVSRVNLGDGFILFELFFDDLGEHFFVELCLRSMEVVVVEDGLVGVLSLDLVKCGLAEATQAEGQIYIRS